MDVKSFLNEYGTYDELAIKISEIYSLHSDDSIELLSDFLRYKDGNSFGKHYTPKIACIALINKGKIGIEKLLVLLTEIKGHIYPKSILECLWFASKDLLKYYIEFYKLKIIEPIKSELGKEIIPIAKNAFYDAIVSFDKNGELIAKLSESMKIYKDYFNSNGLNVDCVADIFDILSEASLKITNLNIKKLSMLIDLELKEEKYQVFFKENPIFIDPIAFRIHDKHKLGDDLITDFVVETLTNEYYVVEIEKPQDRIFNMNGDFSQKFIHAIGQIIDFIDWIESNIAYAQKKLPNIISPKGLLIIGKNNFSEKEMRKLKRFNTNSKSIEILTYDDILLRAENLYKNIRVWKS